MTGVHRGASQDVPLLLFFPGRRWFASSALEQWWSRIVAQAALVHRLHAASAGARCAVGLVARSAVVRVMQWPVEIPQLLGCAGASSAWPQLQQGLARALQR